MKIVFLLLQSFSFVKQLSVWLSVRAPVATFSRALVLSNVNISLTFIYCKFLPLPILSASNNVPLKSCYLVLNTQEVTSFLKNHGT